MAIPLKKLSFAKLIPRIGFLTLLFGLLLNGWIVWQSWEQYQDQTLASDRVAAKQLRVSESSRLKLMQDLTTYQQPPALSVIPKVTFQGGTSTKP